MLVISLASILFNDGTTWLTIDIMLIADVLVILASVLFADAIAGFC